MPLALNGKQNLKTLVGNNTARKFAQFGGEKIIPHLN